MTQLHFRPCYATVFWDIFKRICGSLEISLKKPLTISSFRNCVFRQTVVWFVLLLVTELGSCHSMVLARISVTFPRILLLLPPPRPGNHKSRVLCTRSPRSPRIVTRWCVPNGRQRTVFSPRPVSMAKSSFTIQSFERKCLGFLFLHSCVESF